MDSSSIRAVLVEYLALLRDGGPGGEDSISLLVQVLDRLAMAVHGIEYEFDPTDHPDPSKTPYETRRALAVAAFPELGPYNCARPVSESIGQGEAVVGDAIDDLADIAGDLEETLQRWERSERDALWHLEFSYEHHWGEHLRSLQLYLVMRAHGC